LKVLKWLKAIGNFLYKANPSYIAWEEICKMAEKQPKPSKILQYIKRKKG